MQKPRHPSVKKQIARAVFVASQYTQPRTTLPLIGYVLTSAVLIASSISLVYFATPTKSVERLSSGALTSKLALTGNSRISHRLSSGNLKTAALAGFTLASDRLSSGFLGGKTSLAGKIRTNDRLIGTLGFSAGHQLITGTTRDGSRLLSAGISLLHASTPSRDWPRLRGAFLGGKTSLAGTIRSTDRDLGLLIGKVSVTGTLRVSSRNYAVSTIHSPSALEGSLRAPARLKGALLGGKVALTGNIRSSDRDLAQLQFAGPHTQITGTIRARGFMKSTGMSLVYAATPVKDQARVRGASLGFVGVGGQTFMNGTARDEGRLTGQLGLVYVVAPIQASPRVNNAVFINRQPVSGVLRSVDRLKGASITFPGSPLAGTVRDSERLKGAFLAGKVSLVGTTLDGSILQDAPLNSKTALKGTLRAQARDVGSLHFLGATQISGTSLVLSRIDGADLTGKVSLVGTLIDAARLSSGFLGGKTSLAGTVRSVDLAQPAAFSIRLAIIGKTRSFGYVSGAKLILKSQLGMAGTCIDSVRLRGATLTGKSFLVGTTIASGLLQRGSLDSDMPLTGTMRFIGARLANGLNPVGEPYRILDATDHGVIFAASDRPFIISFEKT